MLTLTDVPTYTLSDIWGEKIFLFQSLYKIQIYDTLQSDFLLEKNS